jgi:hypothetical protein
MHSHGCASEGVADGGAAGGVRAGRAASALEHPIPAFWGCNPV